MNFARFCRFISKEQNSNPGEAYVCVSPLGAKNHPATHAITTTTKPMMMLALLAAHKVSRLYSMTCKARIEYLDTGDLTRLPCLRRLEAWSCSWDEMSL